MNYRAEIDGLRALAVVPVILFHAGFEIFSGGFVGVDIFFVISGFLITSLLIEDIEKQRFSIVDFYERRARRILPALFVVMFVSLVMAWVWMLPSQMKDFSESLIAVSFFVSNMLFWKESGYFAPDSETKPLLHTWSLSVEEQYYVLFPLMLVFLWRYGRNKAFWAIVVLALMSLILSEWGWRNKPTANFYLVISRAWELFAGSIAAFIAVKHGPRPNNTLALIGLGGLLFSLFFYDKSIPFPSLYALVPVLSVVCLLLFAGQPTYVYSFLSNRLFVGIGLISYSAYLWHQPLLAFARITHVGPPDLAVMGALAALSMVLAIISWKYIEGPFRKRKGAKAISRAAIFKSSLVGLVLFSIVGTAGHFTNGFERLIASPAQLDFLATASRSPFSTECHAGRNHPLTYEQSCEYFGEDVSVAVLGDSHAVELSYNLGKLLEPQGLGVKHLSFSGCIPSYGIEVDDFSACSDWTQEVIEALINDDRIDTVVVSYRIAMALYGNHDDSYPEFVDKRGDELRGKIWRALVNTIDTLQASGKRVIYVLQAPELPRTIEYLAPHGDYRPLGVERAWWDQRMHYVYQHLGDLPDNIDIVDPEPIFCDDQHCYAGTATTAFYFDDDHLSLAGSKLVAEQVFNTLQRF